MGRAAGMEGIKIEKINDSQRKSMGIPDTPRRVGHWSVWECEPSVFDWHYSQQETAYIYEGRAKVKMGVQEIEIKVGDLVTFPKGLSCRWEVISKIRKVYTFEE